MARCTRRSSTAVPRNIQTDHDGRKCTSLEEFGKLLHSRTKRICYDHGSRSAEKPGREIEWPIVWLLSAFTRKHIFVPQGILETNRMNTDAIRVGRGMGSSQG